MQFLTIFACALATVAASPVPEDDNIFEKRQLTCANNVAVNVLRGLGTRGQTFCRGLLNLPAVSIIPTTLTAATSFVPTTVLNPTGLCGVGQVPATIPSVSVPTPTLAIPSNIAGLITRILPGFALPTGLVAREAEAEAEAELEKRQLLNLGALSSLLNAAIATASVPSISVPTPSVPTGLPITPSVAIPSIRLPGIVTRVIPGFTLPTGLAARNAEAEIEADFLEKRQLINLGALSSLLGAAIPTISAPSISISTPSVPTGLPITPSVAIPSIRLPGIVTRVIPGFTLPTGLTARDAEADAEALEKRQLLNLPALSAFAGARITAGCSCLSLTQGTASSTVTPPPVVLPTTIPLDTCTTSA